VDREKYGSMVLTAAGFTETSVKKRGLIDSVNAFYAFGPAQHKVPLVTSLGLVISGTIPIDRCWSGERARRV
jgi:hypothetical protein